jgi:hypothetical protein
VTIRLLFNICLLAFNCAVLLANLAFTWMQFFERRKRCRIRAINFREPGTDPINTFVDGLEILVGTMFEKS